MVDHIFNGEQGLKVREKLNEVIDRTNDLMGVENHGQQAVSYTHLTLPTT